MKTFTFVKHCSFAKLSSCYAFLLCGIQSWAHAFGQSLIINTDNFSLGSSKFVNSNYRQLINLAQAREFCIVKATAKYGLSC